MNALLKPIRSLLSRKSDPEHCESGPSAEEAVSPLVETMRCEDVAVHHLWSDQPNALKFQVDRTLLPSGEKREYDSGEAAADSPLAQAIFAAGGIESVVIEGASITVLMAEEADWDGLMQTLPGVIHGFFHNGGVAFPEAAAAQPKKRFEFGFKQVTARSREEQLKIVQELLDGEINPSVAAHGGSFTLLDVKDNNVYVQLGGGCQGCGMADVTLRQGVEARMREVLPEMVSLIDTTDHAAGANPYYQQGKK